MQLINTPGCLPSILHRLRAKEQQLKQDPLRVEEKRFAMKSPLWLSQRRRSNSSLPTAWRALFSTTACRCLAYLSCLALLTGGVAKLYAQQPGNFARESLVAWCVVPFDAKKRSPAERAEMLSELGLKRLAYDWRDEHIETWDEEWRQLQEHDIELTAFWCSSSMDPASHPKNQLIFDFIKRNKIKTQLWIMLPENELAKIEDESQRLEKVVQAITGFAERAAELDCQVGIYNHGGWSGRPATLLAIMQDLKDQKNTGLVYNFHHSHEDLDEFPEALGKMLPHLLCVNLNGMTPGGPKIVPLGKGEMDAKILSWVRDSGYAGPIGILDHRNELDSKLSLQQNLDGLEQLLKAEVEK
ncbi:MAG: sugar phosphate isomerase/epimerase family protein [Pirellulaceae bacterium]